MMIETSVQYAIEYPGKGILSMSRGPSSIYLIGEAEEKSGMLSREDAEQTLKTLKGRYENMGVPEVAETLRIVSRTVTITYPDYQPLEGN